LKRLICLRHVTLSILNGTLSQSYLFTTSSSADLSAEHEQTPFINTPPSHAANTSSFLHVTLANHGKRSFVIRLPGSLLVDSFNQRGGTGANESFLSSRGATAHMRHLSVEDDRIWCAGLPLPLQYLTRLVLSLSKSRSVGKMHRSKERNRSSSSSLTARSPSTTRCWTWRSSRST
jgi:hypothetical protein